MKVVQLMMLCCLAQNLYAQFPPFTQWYENPLGFETLNLHTANGIIVPAAAAAAILLLSKNKPGAPNQAINWYQDVGVSTLPY